MRKTLIRYWIALVLGVVAAWPWPAAAAQVFAVHLTAEKDRTIVALDLPTSAPFQAALDPRGRVIVTFETLMLRPSTARSRGLGLIESFHAEPRASGGVQLVLDLARPATIAAVHALPAEGGEPPKAVIELVAGSAAAMHAASHAVQTAEEKAVSNRQNRASDDIGALIGPPASSETKQRHLEPVELPPAEKTALVPVANVVAPERPEKKSPSIASIISPKRTIVIDAGHGGIDPGADSVAGYHEKEVTLATARVLRRVLEGTGRYKVVLTRDSDVYLKLHERVARARAAHGDLFVSLHADSVSGEGNRSTRGASIYTLSETASDAESERYAQRENRADAIGGVDLGDQSDDVAGILVDLTVRETVNDGNRLAGMMADALEHRGVALLPNAPHRAAGFAVLKSPDIPSILIEMGYLSDKSDSRALADPRHQAQIADAIVDGIDRYFAWLQVSRS